VGWKSTAREHDFQTRRRNELPSRKVSSTKRKSKRCVNMEAAHTILDDTKHSDRRRNIDILVGTCLLHKAPCAAVRAVRYQSTPYPYLAQTDLQAESQCEVATRLLLRLPTFKPAAFSGPPRNLVSSRGPLPSSCRAEGIKLHNTSGNTMEFHCAAYTRWVRPSGWKDRPLSYRSDQRSCCSS
jgi:hypothetical protein